MKNNVSIKNISILLAIILGGIILFFFIIWLILGWTIETNDIKDDKRRAEYFYAEQSKKYEIVNDMNYVYDVKMNIGFFSGGGFTKNDCLEKYIREAWSNKEIISVSLCQDEKINKEKLDILNNFQKEYDKIFRNKDKIRDDYFNQYIRK